jgi:hypothetical protein
MGDASYEWTVSELVVVEWFSVGPGRRAPATTFFRRPQSIRRTSTVSADMGLPIGRESRLESVASWSWYSSSHADLMLISRKRANSFELVEPQPSTILKAIDSAALTIWNLSDPRSLRGNARTARLTLSTSSCARCHTSNRRKSCISAFSGDLRQIRRPFPATARKSFPRRLLTTTDELATHQLTTQNLHPLRPTSNGPLRDAGGTA